MEDSRQLKSPIYLCWLIFPLLSMAEQRQTFRFRLPWLVAAPPPRPPPPPPPPRSAPETQTPRQPTTTATTGPATTPIQRPPVRPPGLAPAPPPPPPQAQPPPGTESQPSSPSRVATQIRVTSPLATPSSVAALSPSLLTQAAPKAASQPSSPSRSAIQSEVVSQLASPSRAATQPRTTSQPPSLSPQTRPPSRTESQPSPQTRSSQRTESQPSPQTRSSPRTESQPSPQTRAAARTESQPSPQMRAATRTESQPPTPFRAAAQSRATTQSASPSRVQRPSSQPSSPSRPASQTTTQARSPSRFASQTLTSAQSQPSSRDLQLATSESSQPLSSSIEPAASVPQQERRSLSPVPQPKEEISSESVEDYRNQTPKQTFQTTGRATQSPEGSRHIGAPATTQKIDSSTVHPQPETLSDLNGKSKESKEEKEVVQEQINVEKTSGMTHEEPKQRTVSELLSAALGLKAPNREHPIVEVPVEQKQLQRQETLDTKDSSATSIQKGKHTKPAILFPKDKNTVSELRQRSATPNAELAPLHKEIRDDISKLVHKISTGNTKHSMDSKPVSVITLAGENKGASMQLGSESGQREDKVHIYRGYKSNLDESAEATTDGEGSSRARRSKDAENEEDHTAKAYVNSNIQGINNSLVFDSSMGERNPGVHLVLSQNQTESNNKIKLDAHRAEVNITPAQKLTYEPVIKRRCLRGLFMESSDSDPENPDKPRRHGCRYSCREKNSNNDIDVL